MPVRVKMTVKKPKWRSTLLLVNAFGDERKPGSLLLSSRRGCGKLAARLAAEMRASLYKNRYKKAPLSPRYLEWKKRKGLDRRILIAYKKYVRNIGVVQTKYGAIIGMVRQTRIDKRGRKTRRLKYALLQRWLEYGTRKKVVLVSGKTKKGKIGSKMPARPHWRPMSRYWKNNRRKYGLQIRNQLGVELRTLLAKGRP